MANQDLGFATSILTGDQLAAIGAVAVEATYLEKLIEILIWELAGLKDDAGLHFTSNIQLKSRIELLAKLAKPRLMDQGLASRFDELISQLLKAAADRNTIIHGQWTPDADEFLRILNEGPECASPAKARKRTANGRSYSEFSADKVEETAKRIHELRLQLLNFSFNLGFNVLDVAKRRLEDE